MAHPPNGTTNKRPSMKDVADLAGVSRTTVSFVLNKKPDANIPEETQQRIWTAVKELGYRPNALARGLRAQSTHTIGFVSDEIATTPYAVRILQGAQDRAWEAGKLLLTVNTGGDPAIRNAGIEKLLERQVDGIIYATMYHREVTPPKNLKEIPAVLLDCFVTDQSLTSVVPNEELGGYTATKHLISKGHRKIAFVCEEKPVPAQVGRLAGYKRALAEAEIPYDSALLHFSSQSDPKEGYRTTMALFSSNKKEKPTAIFYYNDRMAMGGYDALRHLGLSIPQDVAVIGFDNQDLIAADLVPSLSTMALPHQEMGVWAVEQLLKMIRQQNGSQSTPLSIQHQLACPLIVRDST